MCTGGEEKTCGDYSLIHICLYDNADFAGGTFKTHKLNVGKCNTLYLYTLRVVLKLFFFFARTTLTSMK